MSSTVAEFEMISVPLAILPTPGQHMVVENATWGQYEAWDAAIEQHGGGRVSYCDGILEITTLSRELEAVKEFISQLLVTHARSSGQMVHTFGPATTRDEMRSAGKKPDGAWTFGEKAAEKPVPDLVLELVTASEMIDRVDFYARFGVPELWIWDESGLSVLILEGETYRASESSLALPDLLIRLVETASSIPNLSGALDRFEASG